MLTLRLTPNVIYDEYERTRHQTLPYLESIEQTTALSPPTLLKDNQVCLAFLSKRIDQAAQKVYEDLRTCLCHSPSHKNRVYTLANQPRTCGSTKKALALLQGATAFEQMIALEHWLCNYGPLNATQTFCFANNRVCLSGRVVPLTIKKDAYDMLPIMLGNNGRDTLAPKYDDWDGKDQDPWLNPNTENFIYHLEALEMVRQPAFLGATLLKGNAFESEYIDQNWRYGTTSLDGNDRKTAGVEFRKQRRLTQAKLAIKTQSAAYNLMKLMVVRGGILADADLCDHTRTSAYKYFDSRDQRPSEFSMAVLPQDIFQSLKSSFLKERAYDEKDSLYYHMFKLMVAKIGPQTTPELRAFIRERLLKG